MSLIVGKYKLHKNENIDGFFAALGVPYVGRKVISASSLTVEISVSDDNWRICNSSFIFNSDQRFRLDRQYDERLPGKTIKSVTSMKSDNELETNSVLENEATTRRHYLFSEEGCVLSLVHSACPTPGKRYFSRVK